MAGTFYILYINDGEAGSPAAETEYLVITDDGIYRRWTYTGTDTFLGFTFAEGAPALDGLEVGSTISISQIVASYPQVVHEGASIYLYSVVSSASSSDLSISYKGSEIAALSSSGTKILKTAGKYMEDDVEVVYTRPETGPDVSDTTAVAADVLASKIFHLSTGASAVGTIPTKSAADATVNQNVVTFPWGYYPSQVQKTVGIAQAAQTITPGSVNHVISSGRYLTGNQTILGDANLLSENIKSGVSIFGKMGTYEGGASTIIDPLSVVANGTYIAPSGHAYSPVSVNIDTQFGWETAPESWATGLVDMTISGSVYGSMVLTIAPNTFFDCSKLTEISFPACRYIQSSAFYNCRGLSSVSFPMCTRIGELAFASCYGLVSVSFPLCTKIDRMAFYNGPIMMFCYFPNCIYIGSYAFAQNNHLVNVSFPKCVVIGSSAFQGCNTLQSASFPMCIALSDGVFAYCSSLSTAYFPGCRYINVGVFSQCRALTSISFPVCTYIGSNAFNSCSQLTTVTFPLCEIVASSCFQNCKSLISASFPVCEDIQTYAFYSCLSLLSIYIPNCKRIGAYAFGYCGFSQVSIPLCTKVDNYAFQNCSALTSIVFPSCLSIGTYAFSSCSTISLVSLPVCINIQSGAFNGCVALRSIYFTGKFIVTLMLSNVFQYTPIQYSSYLGVFGSIYVPSSLVTGYKTATNWVYYSSRIVGVEMNINE